MHYNRALYEFSSRAIVVRAQIKEGERGNYILYMSVPLIHPTKKSLECMGLNWHLCMCLYFGEMFCATFI